MPGPTELNRAIVNFRGPKGKEVCTLVEAWLGTENAAQFNALKSAVEEGDKVQIGRVLMRLSKETVNKLNGYFDQLGAS